MGLRSLAIKAILITIGLVAAVLGLVVLVVILANLHINPLEILYAMAALLTVSGTVISIFRWLARRKR